MIQKILNTLFLTMFIHFNNNLISPEKQHSFHDNLLISPEKQHSYTRGQAITNTRRISKYVFPKDEIHYKTSKVVNEISLLTFVSFCIFQEFNESDI